jgi:Ca2+-binding RTX toxin-like protein
MKNVPQGIDRVLKTNDYRGPVGNGDVTTAMGDDAWYAYPGSGGSSFYTANGRTHIAEDWNREGGERPSDMAKAIGAGLVVFDGVMSGYGNTVILDHGVAQDGQTHLFSLYAHLASADNFAGAATVSKGQAIGQIGASGGEYAVHLHFELFDADSWVAGVRLSGGSATVAEMAAAQSVTFDAAGAITSVVLMDEVDATLTGEEYIRAFTSDYFISTAAARHRWYDGDSANIYTATGKRGVEAFGLAGADLMRGGKGDDLIAGGRGNDVLVGGKGADELYGDAGRDRLDGTSGRRDDMQGGTGADHLISAGQGDLLLGGASPLPGQAQVLGDGSRDVFEFVAGSKGRATILDFEDGVDKIKLRDMGLDFKDLTILATQDGAKIKAGALTVFLYSIDPDDLRASDFIF